MTDTIQNQAKALTKRYRLPMLLPVLLLLSSVGYLGYGYATTGEWFLRSIELTGGTAVTIPLGNGSLDAVKQATAPFGAQVSEFSGITGSSAIVTVPDGTDADAVLAALAGTGLNVNLATIETVGSGLSEAFWFQAQLAVVAAFILMSIVVFALFRKIAPSIAVIAAAGSDIIVTLAVMQVFQIPLTLAGIGALLMLIGYSVDTDILLTSRMTRRSTDLLAERIRSSMVTGLTMTVAAIVVVAVLLLAGLSPVISTIATVLLIGLVVDIVNTWIQNAALLTWYLSRKGV